MGSKTKPPQKIPPRSYPLFFFLFILWNAFLAYGPFPIEVKLWVGLMGVLVALALVLKAPPSPGMLISPTQEVLRPVPPASFWLLFALAAFIRLYKMSELSVWPMWDEGHYAYLAVNLEEHWHPQFFFGIQQYMPVYTWFQALFFKAFGPSLETIWLYPVLYSLLLLPLAYLTCRQFFSRSFSLIYLLLLSFSFWPLYVSRFATDIGWCLIWEHWVLLLLARALRSLPRHGKTPAQNFILLGLAIGVGWYFSKFWISSIAVFTLGVLYLLYRKNAAKPRPPLPFLSAVALPLLPMAYLIATHQYGAHIQSYLSMKESHVSWLSHFIDSLSYITALFWGPLYKGHFSFGPLWGGFLNPVLDAFFFLALFLLWGNRKNGTLLWLLPALGLYLAQGFVSNNLEFMRIAPVLPLLLATVALGIQSLLGVIPVKGRILALSALMAGSVGSDAYHWFGAYHSWAIPSQETGNSKPPEHYRAYQTMEAQSLTHGPGLVLEEFVTNIFNQTLLGTTYPFNAARNPRFSPSDAAWAGILASPSYRREFYGWFPGARLYPLSEGLAKYDEAWDLWILPVTERNRPRLTRMMAANRLIQDLYDVIPYDVADPSYRKVLQGLLENYGMFQGDGFLEPTFWAKIAEFAWEQKDRDLFLKAAGKVVGSGHPQSRLCYRIGLTHEAMGDFLAAKGDFLEAGRLDPEYEPPADKLKWLDTMAKAKPSPAPRRQDSK